jgi:hypothetical protein
MHMSRETNHGTLLVQEHAPSYVTSARILLPMDLSDSSYGALEVAADLALSFHAQLILVHIVAEIPEFTGPDFNNALFLRSSPEGR